MIKSSLKTVQTVIFILLCVFSGSSMAIDLLEMVKDCARKEDSSARFSCYEKLGEEVLKHEDSTLSSDHAQNKGEGGAPVTTAVDEGEAAQTLPDELGGQAFIPEAKKRNNKAEPSRGLVTSCKQAVDKRWFYIFENGQVWKQVDSKRRRHKQCNFYVNVVKDRFGYKMQIDKGNEYIRIKRKR